MTKLPVSPFRSKKEARADWLALYSRQEMELCLRKGWVLWGSPQQLLQAAREQAVLDERARVAAKAKEVSDLRPPPGLAGS